MRFIASGLVSAALLLATLAGCSDPAFVVGTEAAFPPFESVAEDGSLEGFDVDLMHAIAGDLRASGAVEEPLEIRNLDFAALIGDLEAGRLDAICSGMSRTDERAERVDFSRPYARVPTGVLVSTSLVAAADGAVALEGAGVTIAVQRKTTGETKATERFPNATIRAFDREADAAAEVAAGRAHALVYDMVSIVRLHAQNPESTRILDTTLGTEFYAIAFRKGSPLVAPVDAYLERESRPGGEVDRLLAKWLGDAARFRVDDE